MQNNKPDYYNDLEKVYTKIWELLESGLKRRDVPFHIPTFICGDKKKFDGRIVVLRGIDKEDIAWRTQYPNIAKKIDGLEKRLHRMEELEKRHNGDGK